jgi:hypothetical protein
MMDVLASRMMDILASNAGGLVYDIIPGQPDKSILAYRIASTHPGVMMPELRKRLVHEEGVALVREWIAAMAVPGR